MMKLPPLPPHSMQHSSIVPTYLAIVPILAQHLRSNVVGGAACGVQQLCSCAAISIRIADIQSRKAEIADFEVAVGVEQEILTNIKQVTSMQASRQGCGLG